MQINGTGSVPTASAVPGQIVFDSSNNTFNGYNGTTWASFIAPVTTVWSSYTPNLTSASSPQPSLGSGVPFTQEGRYRRVGDSLEVQVKFRWGSTSPSGGSSTSGKYQISLPGTCIVDSAKLTTGGSIPTTTVGHGWMSTGATSYSIEATADSSTSYVNLFAGSTGQPITAIDPVPWGSTGDQVTIRFTVPVVGWTTNTPAGGC